MRRLLLALPVALALAGCAVPGAPSPQPQIPPPFPNVHQSASGFTVSFPVGWTVRERATFPVGNRVLRGTAFIFPAEQARSTLVGAEVFVTLEPACPSQPGAETIRREDAVWLRSSWTDAGAGNRYAVTLSTAEPGRGCLIVATLIHACALEDACPPGHTEPLDEESIQSMLDAVGMTARAI